MNENPKQTSTHYVVVLVDQARRLGLDVGRLLSETGIPTELADVEDRWIDNSYLTSLSKAMMRETNDETMGFDPVPLRPGSWALACEFMLTAETLGELLRKGKHILSYIAPDSSIGIHIRDDGDMVTLEPAFFDGKYDANHFLSESMLLLWHRFSSWVIDENIQPQKIFVAYPKPEHGHLYDEFFQCPFEFNQAFSGFSFARKYLKRPLVRSKIELDAWLRNSPADILYLPGRETSVQCQIKNALKVGLMDFSRFPPFEKVCSMLCMSQQVVRSRLAEEGTSYQKIKDSVRLEVSQELLCNPDILIADIAYRTGFTEPAAFSRAFKKWVGISPAQFRADRLLSKLSN